MFKKKALTKLIAASIAAGILSFTSMISPANDFNDVPILQTSVAHAKSAEDHYNLGNKYYKSGNYRQAIVEYTEAIRLTQPGCYIDAYFCRGFAYHKLKNYDAAIKDYTKVIESTKGFLGIPTMNRLSCEAYYNRAGAYAVSGNLEAALKDFTKVIELQPDKGKAYYLRGLIYKAMGDNTKAQADYAKARELGYNG